MEIVFTIPGQPVAKARPKFARRGAHVVAYTPAKSASYESLVKMAATTAMCGRDPSARAIGLVVNLYFQIPSSWSNRRRASAAAGDIHPTKKPDADNVLKALKDGCNGIVWRDDAQVVCITLIKRYGEQPRAEIRANEVVGEPA